MPVVGIYEKGPAWADEKPLGGQVGISDHLEYLGALIHRLDVTQAGPFYRMEDRVEDQLVGMVIFASDDLAQARHLAERDPAVLGGLMRFSLRLWYP